MRLSANKVKEACQRRNLQLKQLLKKARVSPTAYYSLVRKDSILPRTIQALAKTLALSESELLEDEMLLVRQMQQIRIVSEKIYKKNPGADQENIFHTLLLLEDTPVERLNRGLQRAQSVNIQRRGV